MLTFYFDIYVVCWISIIRPNLYRFHDIKRTYIQINKKMCARFMLQSSKMICQSHPFMCIGGFMVLVLEFFPILWLWSYKFASHALHMYLLYFSLAISVYFMHCAYLFAKYWQMVRFFPISLPLSAAVCCFISLNDLRFFSSINSRLLHVRF